MKNLTISGQNAPLGPACRPQSHYPGKATLGWDNGRGSVTDYRWDFLPALGYAVRDPVTQEYTLFELRDDLLYPIDAERALDLRLLDAQGRLVRHGQPVITACENVRPFLDRYADADCTLSTGNRETLMTAVQGGNLPPAAWFVGKRPMDVRRYPEQSIMPKP